MFVVRRLQGDCAPLLLHPPQPQYPTPLLTNWFLMFELMTERQENADVLFGQKLWLLVLLEVLYFNG